MTMRCSWFRWLAGVASTLAATSAFAAVTPQPRQLVQPALADLIFARTGIARPAPPDGRTVATFDFDQDGDLDLFVGSQQGSVIWLNDGVGLFSLLPLTWAKSASHATPQTWVATEIATLTPLDRTDPVAARTRTAVPFHCDVLGFVPPAPIAPIPSQLSPASTPRAPPGH